MTTQNINTTQLPVQVAAERNESKGKNSSKKVYGLLDGPDPDITRIVKLTLYHLNGSISNMVMQMPNYSAWWCHHNHAATIINEYVYFMASSFLQIEKFQAECGVIRDGQYTKSKIPSFDTQLKVIPVDKVFIPGTSGRWVSLEEGAKIEAEKKAIEQKGGANNEN